MCSLTDGRLFKIDHLGPALCQLTRGPTFGKAICAEITCSAIIIPA